MTERRNHAVPARVERAIGNGRDDRVTALHRRAQKRTCAHGIEVRRGAEQRREVGIARASGEALETLDQARAVDVDDDGVAVRLHALAVERKQRVDRLPLAILR